MQRIEIEDRAGTGQRAQVEAAIAAAMGKLDAAGAGLRRPLRVVLERLLIPGFLETQNDRHVLHLQADAARAPWLPGLALRELAHAALADLGHPSHDPALLQAGFAAARDRSRDVRFLSVVGTLNHHVRDVYADDLAARADADAVQSFLEHLARGAAAMGPGPHRAVTAGYAAATLLRRGGLAPEPLRLLLGQDVTARGLADQLAALPPDPEPADLEDALRKLVARLPAEAAP
ncbi:MAG TPA: DUF5781 family protein [Candidatus Thermoplasmatota archaeon]|nr:DUF5781 family protein [Candidatus Thermoplasmatota archaeon]